MGIAECCCHHSALALQPGLCDKSGLTYQSSQDIVGERRRASSRISAMKMEAGNQPTGEAGLACVTRGKGEEEWSALRRRRRRMHQKTVTVAKGVLQAHNAGALSAGYSVHECADTFVAAGWN